MLHKSFTNLVNFSFFLVTIILSLSNPHLRGTFREFLFLGWMGMGVYLILIFYVGCVRVGGTKAKNFSFLRNFSKIYSVKPNKIASSQKLRRRGQRPSRSCDNSGFAKLVSNLFV